METLKEHNEKVLKWYGSIKSPKPNDLICECGAELWDNDPMMSLSTHPVTYGVHCPKCGFTGTRY